MPMARLTVATTPKARGLKPIAFITGSRMGIKMYIADPVSTNIPAISSMILTSKRMTYLLELKDSIVSERVLAIPVVVRI